MKEMDMEYPGEKIFLKEVEAIGKVWVVKGANQNVYSLQLDETGYSLPVWSHQQRVIEYLRNARLVGSDYEPYAVPLDIFTNVWLSDKMMDISELLINLNGLTTRALVLTIEEFKASQYLLKAS
jgi:hypothetical protein